MYLNYSLEMGGIEIMIVNMASAIKVEGFNPSICVLKGGGTLEQIAINNDIKVLNMDKKAGIDFNLIFKLRKTLRDNNIRVIHTNNYSSWMYGALSAFLLRNVKLIHTEHSIVEGPPRRYWLEKALSLMTDHTIAVSESVKNGMVVKALINRNNITVIDNGIDTERYRPDEKKRKEARKALNIKPNEIAIGIVARLELVKNHALLIDAFEIVHSGNENVKLIIVGDGSIRTELEKRARALSANEKILFLGERKDIGYVMNALDIFVLSSLSEGMSLTLLEAMSSGLATVATAVGGNVSTIKDGETGVLVKSEDIQEMATTIEKLAQSEHERIRLGENARNKILKKYSETVMTNKYMELYSIK